MLKPLRRLLVAVAAAGMLPAVVMASLESGTTIFENLDTPPLYFKATVNYEIFSPGDATSPAPSTTDYTYVYTLANQAVAPPAGQVNIPLDRLDIGVGSSANITSASSIGTGVAPSSIDTSILTKVSFLFASPFINPAESSNQLVIHSPNGPGDVTATVAFGGSNDDQLLRGPFALPNKDFACYGVNKVKLLFKKNKTGHDQIKIEKTAFGFTAGDSFDPTTDIVKLDLNNGAYVLSIPAGSFERKGSREVFKYETGSGVSPKVRFRINVDKGEWSVRIGKTDITTLINAADLNVMLMIGDVKGQDLVPLTVAEDNNKVTHVKFHRKPRFECPKLRPDDSSVANDSGNGYGHHSRSCLSSFEVTYHKGLPDQEIIEIFGSDIGHPSTTVSIQSGSGATFDTSCKACIQCGVTDAAGDFEVTGLSDAVGKLTNKCGGIDPSCDATPPAQGETGWMCVANSDCGSGICTTGLCE
ncbi:MAG TPA: hypothetical protein ENJ80_07730 [Gammaproteobacteria bacterium]|nr:hypothetical protein [Gammaproteobacteria bacterium]